MSRIIIPMLLVMQVSAKSADISENPNTVTTSRTPSPKKTRKRRHSRAVVSDDDDADNVDGAGDDDFVQSPSLTAKIKRT